LSIGATQRLTDEMSHGLTTDKSGQHWDLLRHHGSELPLVTGVGPGDVAIERGFGGTFAGEIGGAEGAGRQAEIGIAGSIPFSIPAVAG